MKRASLSVLSLLILLISMGCSRGGAAGEPGKTGGKTAPSGATEKVTTTVPGKASPSSLVKTIVFVGKKEPCPCTRKRIDDSWEVLQSAMEQSRKVKVERIQQDVDREKVERYTKLKPLMVLPGLYFLDEEGTLVELLQGEVEVDQIRELLK